MSFEMIERWKNVQASPTQRFVGWILADAHNGKTKLCNPSISRIVKLTGFSERTVIQAIHDLEKAGHISVLRVTGERSRYDLHPLPSCTPEGDAPLKEIQGTPDPAAPPPLTLLHPTPDPAAPLYRTGIEPEDKPEPTGTREWPVDYSAEGNPRLIQKIVADYPSQTGRPMEAVRALSLLASEGADLKDIHRKVLVHRERYQALPMKRRQYCPRIHTYFENNQFNASPDEAPWVYLDDSEAQSPPELTDGQKQRRKEAEARFEELKRREAETAASDLEKWNARAAWRNANPETRSPIPPFATEAEIIHYGGIIES